MYRTYAASCSDEAPYGRKRENYQMLIQAGFDIHSMSAQTPMLLQLNVHPSREADLLSRDLITSDPELAMRSYLDLYGNRVTRVEVPPELVTFSNRFVIHDSGQPDETPHDTELTPIAGLPDEPLLRQPLAALVDVWTDRRLNAFKRFAISSIRKSASAIPMRARRVAPAIPCRKASASVAISPIWPSRFAAA